MIDKTKVKSMVSGRAGYALVIGIILVLLGIIVLLIASGDDSDTTQDAVAATTTTVAEETTTTSTTVGPTTTQVPITTTTLNASSAMASLSVSERIGLARDALRDEGYGYLLVGLNDSDLIGLGDSFCALALVSDSQTEFSLAVVVAATGYYSGAEAGALAGAFGGAMCFDLMLSLR